MRSQEDTLTGLTRKLNRRLMPSQPPSNVEGGQEQLEEQQQYKFEIAELIGVWWRPDFDENMFPYLPSHVTNPKERREIYFIPLPQHLDFAIPQNFKLIAVPLFELYDNSHRYGPILSSLPQILGRINFVCRDS